MAKRPVRTKANLRDDFLAWQCRIRQVAMREEGGRPSPGMRPRVLDSSGRELSAAITTLLIPKEPEESTAFFRHQVMRTPDPRDIYERALTFLQADYFQDPDAFGDRMVSVLSAGAALAASLLAEGECILAFEQGRQRYQHSLQGARNEAGQPRSRGGHLAQSPVQSCLARYGACARVQAGLDFGHARRLTKKTKAGLSPGPRSSREVSTSRRSYRRPATVRTPPAKVR